MSLTFFVPMVGGIVSWFGGGASTREFWVRTIGFSFLTAVGVIPAVHWAMIAPPLTRDGPLRGIIGMFSAYGTGLFFYVSELDYNILKSSYRLNLVTSFQVSKIPERFWPDFVSRTHFTSHTIW
jgi:hypothetical protein